MSIVTYPSKKTDHNEVIAILDLLQCSILSAYRQQRKASTKRGHLIAKVKNTSVKWSIKPCIVRTKKIIKALRQEIVDWIMKNSNVCQYPITLDTLLIADVDTKVKRRVPKLLSFMVFNFFRRHAFKYSCIYLEVLQMAQPHIIP